MSNFLNFYLEHNLHPVNQDISDLKLHFKRRIDLYREIGLPQIVFNSKDVLEVAPGSGYNSFVTASLGLKSFDLIEPNITGYNEMLSLFNKMDITENNIKFYNLKLEEFSQNKMYDIVLCEGLLPGLNNNLHFLSNLQSRVKEGGILVITTIDSVSIFFETLRRYLAIILIKYNNIEDFDQKVDILTKAFSSHLSTLIGMSRSINDWVIDNLINPASISLGNENEFSFPRAIENLGDDFIFYGSSPNFISNYKWYKDVQDSKSYNYSIIEDYYLKIHNLMNKNEIGTSTMYDNKLLIKLTKKFSTTVENKYENIHINEHFEIKSIKNDLLILNDIYDLLFKNSLNNSAKALLEFMTLFSNDNIPNVSEISNMKIFNSSFGRGQQYVSFIKS
jgi:2-polyprenyl-3-methyl-5-hydroxy-6-metoxy-1,4-benzoquinol methylase